jgi:hypothetical protein
VATKKHVILFLAADPSGTDRLAPDREALGQSAEVMALIAASRAAQTEQRRRRRGLIAGAFAASPHQHAELV